MLLLDFLEDMDQEYFQESEEDDSTRGPQCRPRLRRLLENPRFEWIITIGVILNACFLAGDTPYTEDNCVKNPCNAHSMVLFISNLVFVSFFTIEMIIKLFAYGLRGYIANRWNLIDAFTVVTSIAGLFVPVLKVCRSVRTIRLVSRISSLKQVVTSLVKAVPALGTVVLVLGFIWLVFGILGVQLLMGRFWKCEDWDQPGIAFNETECEAAGLDWHRPRWDFDNLAVAFVSLTIVAFGEGWSVYLWEAVDSTGPGEAPQVNASPWLGLYFIVFFVFGSFLALNLFVGTLIDEFLSRSDEVSALSPEQKTFLRSIKIVMGSSLPPPRKPPAQVWRKRVWKICVSMEFELFVSGMIMLNILIMTLEHYQQSEAWDAFLDAANLFFVAFFALEAAMKIVSYGLTMYLRDHWNKFDFFVVIISLIAIPFDGPGTSVFRVFRVLRIFRLVKRFKALQVCFVTLFSALPSLLNIVMVLLLCFFIFGVMGVQLFGRIPYDQVTLSLSLT